MSGILRSPLRFILRLLATAVVVLGTTVCALLLLDQVHRPTAPVDPGIAAVDTTRHARLLVLLVDSWRYESAIDPQLMPRVARLRTMGASWRLEGVFEGFTIPSVRAAFSGHAETQLVNLVRNFRFRALPIESFFLDASRLGKRSLVVAREPFTQFGPYFTERLPDTRVRDMYASDRIRPGIALDGYRAGDFDIVVCHYESADWVAHESGIHSARYRREFAYADSLIEAFAEARRPGDYLLVYGDHGHSATGEHKTGLDIPTFGLLLGPDVTPGITTSPLAMTDLRFIASHAMGIALRAAPYDTPQIARFLPTGADTSERLAAAPNAAPRAALRAVPRGVSRSVTDYLLAFIAVAVLALLGRVMLARVGAPVAWSPALFGVVALFAVEVAVQQLVTPRFTLFPLLLITLGVAATVRPWMERAAVVAVGLLFVSLLPFTGQAAGSAPIGLGALIPLYVAGIGAKFLFLAGVVGAVRWKRAAAWTLVLALLELRVWDHPLAAAAVLLAAGAAYAAADDASARRLALVVALQALVYFTLRLPLYQLAWIDLFLGAGWLVFQTRDDAWTDALLVSGAYTLTCGWLASSLEWGFLYTMFPAHLVELQVQYFLPVIVAKIPLLLILAIVVTGRGATRRLATLLLAYGAVRLAAAWGMRLAGASGAEVWPLAEQAAYVATFSTAVIAWGWHAHATARSTPDAKSLP